MMGDAEGKRFYGNKTIYPYSIQAAGGGFKKTRRALLLVFTLLLSAMMPAMPPAAPWGDDWAAEAERWRSAGFTDAVVELWDGASFFKETGVRWEYELNLTVVMFHGSGWDRKKIQKRLERMAVIYSQCGVRLGRILFVEAGSPAGVVDFGKPGGWDRVIAEKTPTVEKPVLYYFRSIPKYNAFAWTQNQEDDDIPEALRGTAWFSLSVSLGLNEEIRGGRYVSEAHEVGHILMDSLDHYVGAEKNLMGEGFDSQGERLTAEQCERMRRSPLLKPVRR